MENRITCTAYVGVCVCVIRNVISQKRRNKATNLMVLAIYRNSSAPMYNLESSCFLSQYPSQLLQYLAFVDSSRYEGSREHAYEVITTKYTNPMTTFAPIHA
jgi:hypothetical protein